MAFLKLQLFRTTPDSGDPTVEAWDSFCSIAADQVTSNNCLASINVFVRGVKGVARPWTEITRSIVSSIFRWITQAC